ncbi:Immunoglobulin superfamily DCC subclas member 4 [Taenia crassiceps]|uniref:Immunoglobulin superfamily DCC subclas member 4 n=1 Tax=Taenia crassiceps TaxID=6207 RepID=A0ABR4QDZ0_9CEST
MNSGGVFDKLQKLIRRITCRTSERSGRLPLHDHSITGVFLEEDLAPTLARHAGGPMTLRCAAALKGKFLCTSLFRVLKRDENESFKVLKSSEKFVNITVEEGAPELTLQCNRKDHRVVWYKDGLKLHPSPHLQVNSTGSLRLLDVNEGHTGVYRCFVDLQTKAKLVRSYSIQVAYKPVALSHFAKSVYLTAGQPGHIVCCLSGFPEVTQVMWHRSPSPGVVGLEQGEMTSTGLQCLSNQPFSIEELMRASHLLNGVTCYKKLISNVWPEMSGVYTCQGKNSLGWGSLSVPFDVFVRARPYFTQKPEKFPSGDVTFAEVLRSCKAAGNPPPEITWVKYVLKAAKHMKRNVSTSFEMMRLGEQWMLCPVESRTLCWTTERHEVATSEVTQASGIFACIASNDLGFQIALTNLVTSKLTSEWQFTIGIDVTDSLPCGLKVLIEMFTWTPATIPKKMILEHQDCSFWAEFSTSLREKQWKRETISRESMRLGEFKVRGLPSNTLTAVRVFVSCSRGRSTVSNTVYAWTKVATDDPECSLIETHLESRADSEDENANAPMKILLTCGSLVLSLLSVLACLLLRRGFRSRLKNNLHRANYSLPQQSSLWTDRCGDSPSTYKTPTYAPAAADATSVVKDNLQLVAQVPEQLLLPELSFQRLDGTQVVKVITNSIDDSRLPKDAPTERFNVSFFPHLGIFNIRQMCKRRRMWPLPETGSKHKSCGDSLQGPQVYTQLSTCALKLPDLIAPRCACEGHPCGGSSREVWSEGKKSAVQVLERTFHCSQEQAPTDSNYYNI